MSILQVWQSADMESVHARLNWTLEAKVTRREIIEAEKMRLTMEVLLDRVRPLMWLSMPSHDRNAMRRVTARQWLRRLEFTRREVREQGGIDAWAEREVAAARAQGVLVEGGARHLSAEFLTRAMTTEVEWG